MYELKRQKILLCVLPSPFLQKQLNVSVKVRMKRRPKCSNESSFLIVMKERQH